MEKKPKRSDETTYWLHGDQSTYKGRKPDPQLVKASQGLPIYTIIKTMTDFHNNKQKAE